MSISEALLASSSVPDSVLSHQQPLSQEAELTCTWSPWCWCVSSPNRQMQIKQCMSISLGDCEMCRKFVTHSCNHTHCEHPVYLASSLMIGCGVSAHYWQLGIAPMEHAFPMTEIQRAAVTCVCPLFQPYREKKKLKTPAQSLKWIAYWLSKLGCSTARRALNDL